MTTATLTGHEVTRNALGNVGIVGTDTGESRCKHYEVAEHREAYEGFLSRAIGGEEFGDDERDELVARMTELGISREQFNSDATCLLSYETCKDRETLSDDEHAERIAALKVDHPPKMTALPGGHFGQQWPREVVEAMHEQKADKQHREWVASVPQKFPFIFATQKKSRGKRS